MSQLRTMDFNFVVEASSPYAQFVYKMSSKTENFEKKLCAYITCLAPSSCSSRSLTPPPSPGQGDNET